MFLMSTVGWPTYTNSRCTAAVAVDAHPQLIFQLTTHNALKHIPFCHMHDYLKLQLSSIFKWGRGKAKYAMQSHGVSL